MIIYIGPPFVTSSIYCALSLGENDVIGLIGKVNQKEQLEADKRCGM